MRGDGETGKSRSKPRDSIPWELMRCTFPTERRQWALTDFSLSPHLPLSLSPHLPISLSLSLSPALLFPCF
jgi:hypothetical protein